jgi:hypothetical protein
MEEFMMKRVLAVAATIAIGAPALWWHTVQAFDPQPDPPAFGMVSVRSGEAIQLHAVCSEHGIGRVAPKACAAQLMLHDEAGNVVAKQDVRLKPGQGATLEYSLPIGAGLERVGIIPCIVPNPLGGRVLPTAELVDSETDRTLLLINPLTPRLSFLAVGYAE